MTTKNILSVHEAGSHHWVGDGFPVRNFFPSTGLENEVSPFLMLDYAGPQYFAPSEKQHGVGEHPHRGFETVTIAYQGSVEHRDSGGNQGVINPGDVQWMTAGSGVVHEELHEKNFARQGGNFEMVQLWVNLPRQHKMTAPRYQTLLAREISHHALGKDSSFVRVIAGELEGVKGPAQTFTPIELFDVRLGKGEKASLKLPRRHSFSFLVLKGSIEVAGVVAREAQLALLDTDGEELAIAALEESTILIMGGEPINEPVASYGPFVMNTEAELVAAVKDYRSGKMGHLAPR